VFEGDLAVLTGFYTFMTALAGALLMVPFLRSWALSRGDLDLPDARKVHETPMPRLGGIAIYLSFLFAAIVFVPFTDPVRGLLAGGLVIFVTGLVDDLAELSPRHKFAGEIAACLVTIVIGQLWLSDLGNLFGSGDILLPAWLGIPFTVFAVVGIINALNLIDGLDGLAGGISVLALTAFCLLAWVDHNDDAVLIALSLGGALLGFLKYNLYPARIFMGDAGSLTLGFLLGFLAVYLTQAPGSSIGSMVPVLVLALPLFDTIWVMSRRIVQGQSPFVADRTHVHHKFLDLGFEHRFTVIVIFTLSSFWGCSAILLRNLPEYLLLIFLLSTATLFYLLLRYLLRNHGRFALLQRDSWSGLRCSKTYISIAARVDKGVPSLFVFLVIYLLTALASQLTSGSQVPWQAPVVLLGAVAFLWLRPLDEDRRFLMLLLYAAAGVAAVEIWGNETLLFADLSVKRFGDVLLGLCGLIVLAKLQFSQLRDFELSSADYLTIAVCVFLVIVTQQASLGIHLDGALFRTIVLILAIRTYCHGRVKRVERVSVSMALFLLGAAALCFI
jgi:UDP-GlcNAc:undecaprenyl-phosphate GlcNAc-1-phosphate transferase